MLSLLRHTTGQEAICEVQKKRRLTFSSQVVFVQATDNTRSSSSLLAAAMHQLHLLGIDGDICEQALIDPAEVAQAIRAFWVAFCLKIEQVNLFQRDHLSTNMSEQYNNSFWASSYPGHLWSRSLLLLRASTVELVSCNSPNIPTRSTFSISESDWFSWVPRFMTSFTLPTPARKTLRTFSEAFKNCLTTLKSGRIASYHRVALLLVTGQL